jgi:ribonuclease-3
LIGGYNEKTDFHLYKSEKIMDFDKSIKEIEEKIGYEFSDKSLLRQAFTRTSFCNEVKSKGTRYQSNEVLEFFGDSVLSAAIITLFMKDKAKRYEYGISTELSEGDFSNIKSKLSDKSNLSRRVETLGLEKYLIMGEGDTKLGIWREPSVKEDLFESIIGAIYIDSKENMRTVISVVSRMLDVDEYMSKDKVIQSYKNALQEFCADKKRRMPAPVYKTLSETGPEHKKEYERGCFVGERLVAVGKGKNFKIADAEAAEAALTLLRGEETKKEDSRPLSNALQRLKEMSEREKKPSPEFRDLGETLRSSAGTPEFEIECRFMGMIAHGVAKDKRRAKEISAERLLEMIAKDRGENIKKIAKTSHRKLVKSEVKAEENTEKAKKNEVAILPRAAKKRNVTKSAPKHQNKKLKQHSAAKIKRS